MDVSFRYNKVLKVSLVLSFLLLHTTHAKIDHIELEDDQRSLINLVSYGIYVDGHLDISLNLTFDKKEFVKGSCGSQDIDGEKPQLGLTIDKTRQSAAQVPQYGESHAEESQIWNRRDQSAKKVLVKFYIEKGYATVLKSDEMMQLDIRSTMSDKEGEETDTSDGDEAGAPPGNATGDDDNGSDVGDTGNAVGASDNKERVEDKGDNTPNKDDTEVRKRRADDSDTETMGTTDPPQEIDTEETTESVAEATVTEAAPKEEVVVKETAPAGTSHDDKAAILPGVSNGTLPLDVSQESDFITVFLKFQLTVTNVTDQALYSIFFHDCAQNDLKQVAKIKSLTADITGKNSEPETYLSAGDIPKPYLFYSISGIYLVISFVWLRVLRNASSGVFKTHYLMLAVCYCKILSALFHGTNFYIIGKQGKEETGWAVVYYISYLMKTVMLFLTIMLVGTGWAFVKHIFSDKEKKLFLVAIPLQVLVYVSRVIMAETEIAAKAYSTWHTIAIVVDMLCCAAILLPVIWSIRHLTEASQTNGKAAINLQKLKLFKTLYVMVIAYIYVTRIVILVFEYTLLYNYSWLTDFFTEVTVVLFLATLGYKFRPADDNPYFQIPPDSDDEDENIELAVTQSGVTSDTHRRVVKVNGESDDIEKQTLIPKNRRNNESSHELD